MRRSLQGPAPDQSRSACRNDSVGKWVERAGKSGHHGFIASGCITGSGTSPARARQLRAKAQPGGPPEVLQGLAELIHHQCPGRIGMPLLQEQGTLRVSPNGASTNSVSFSSRCERMNCLMPSGLESRPSWSKRLVMVGSVVTLGGSLL